MLATLWHWAPLLFTNFSPIFQGPFIQLHNGWRICICPVWLGGEATVGMHPPLDFAHLSQWYIYIGFLTTYALTPSNIFKKHLLSSSKILRLGLRFDYRLHRSVGINPQKVGRIESNCPLAAPGTSTHLEQWLPRPET